MDELLRSASNLGLRWYETKLFIEHAVSFSNDSLHVLAGVLILLLAAIVLRRPISSWQPWLVVAVLLLANEAADLAIERWPDPGMQYGEGARDVLLTMFLPTLLLFAARWAPQLFQPAPLKRDDRVTPSKKD